MRIRRRILILFAAAVAVLSACAAVVKNYRTSEPVVMAARQGAAGVLTLKVDSIDFRKDLTRVYCRASGRPNTSQRVDAVTLTVGNKAMGATDIDGVEMKKYFQFEDEGFIPLEIDFPATRSGRRGTLTFVTVLGTYTYNIR